MYKKASTHTSADAEYDALKEQDRRAKIRERHKSKDSIMNPERTTKSQDMRRTYQLEFRKMIEAERNPRKASDSKSPVKETNRDRLSTHRDMTSANKKERETSADKH